VAKHVSAEFPLCQPAHLPCCPQPVNNTSESCPACHISDTVAAKKTLEQERLKSLPQTPNALSHQNPPATTSRQPPHPAVNSLPACVTGLRSLVSKTISAFRSSLSLRSGKRASKRAYVCHAAFSKEIIYMKLKALVLVFAALLFISLSAQASTVVACCGNPACCDSGGCCKWSVKRSCPHSFRLQFRERVWARCTSVPLRISETYEHIRIYRRRDFPSATSPQTPRWQHRDTRR